MGAAAKHRRVSNKLYHRILYIYSLYPPFSFQTAKNMNEVFRDIDSKVQKHSESDITLTNVEIKPLLLFQNSIRPGFKKSEEHQDISPCEHLERKSQTIKIFRKKRLKWETQTSFCRASFVNPQWHASTAQVNVAMVYLRCIIRKLSHRFLWNSALASTHTYLWICQLVHEMERKPFTQTKSNTFFTPLQENTKYIRHRL